MRDVLELHGITRRFGDRTALDAVSFTVRPGRLTGFVGANGAGKTTAMRIVLGVLAADAGEVTLDGVPLTRDVRRRFGYMPEERGLYPTMKVRDQLVHLGRLYGLTRAQARGRTEQMLDQLGLAERADDRLSTLSLGNQQRVQVAAALVHDPVLLVLDEPFSGLDPLAVDQMAELLRARADDGAPVLFSSHQLDLVERLCDDVVIIDRGRVLAAGDAQELRSGRGGRRLRVRVEQVGDGDPFGQLPGLRVVGRDGQQWVVELAEGTDEQVVLAAAQAAGVLRELTPLAPRLAEIFREVVR